MKGIHGGVILALALLIGGCLDDSSVPQSPSANPAPEQELENGRTIVHGYDGRRITNALGANLPGFTQHYVGTANANEPTVAIAPRGTAFTYGLPPIGPLGGPSVFRSRDQGLTWEEVTPTMAGIAKAVPLTADGYVEVDPVTGRVFFVNFLPGCGSIQFTDDEGETWTQSSVDNCYIGEVAGSESHDHPTVTVGVNVRSSETDHPTLFYYCVNRADGTCYTSLDGGLTFEEPVTIGLGYCDGSLGPITAGPSGTVYVPQTACQGDGSVDLAKVSISHDGGRTWEVSSLGAAVKPSNRYTSVHEGNIAVDAAGNLFYLYLDDHQLPVLSVSRDDGLTWTHPRHVGAPGVTATTLGAIAAGDEGAVAILYIGTTAAGGHEPADVESATWNAYVTISYNALGQEPLFVTTTINDPADPVKRGRCNDRCMGTGGVDRVGAWQGMYDFLDIDVAPDGRVWASIVDLCNDLCAEPGGSASSPQLGRGAVGVQTSGPLLSSTTTG